MKKDLLFFSVIFIILISFMIFPMRHCISGQDSLTYHLPVARYIAENNAIPDQIPYCYQTDNPEDT